MAVVLRAKGDYEESLRFFRRLADQRESDETAKRLAPGNPAWRIHVACLHWLSRNRDKAVAPMRALAAGILDGSIKYGDAAGGMSQGLLLYHKAIASSLPTEASFALDYLKDRVKRNSGQKIWPTPVAQYYLGELSFDGVMDAVNRLPTLTGPLAAEQRELSLRRRQCVALFHGGVKFSDGLCRSHRFRHFLLRDVRFAPRADQRGGQRELLLKGIVFGPKLRVLHPSSIVLRPPQPE